jgi:2,5-diketo-D-gluconate reductase A
MTCTWRHGRRSSSSATRAGHGRSAYQISSRNTDRIIGATGITPAVNQIELHPWFQQDELGAFHAEHGILTEAWSPLARGGELLHDPAVEKIAAALGRTPAQVVLRWHVQLGNVVIPKSVTPARIKENFQIFDFGLEDDQMRAIGALEAGRRIGPDPATLSMAGGLR